MHLPRNGPPAEEMCWVHSEFKHIETCYLSWNLRLDFDKLKPGIL